MASSGSATSGGGGSIFADSATSADLSPDFLESLREEVLSGGFPDFVAGPNLTAFLSGVLAPDGLVSDLLASEGLGLDDFVSDDFASVDFGVAEPCPDDCACDRALTAGFFVADLTLAMP
jgi:hypothetical protein